MDLVLSSMKTEALVGGASSVVVGFWFLWRRRGEARPSWWLRLVEKYPKKTIVEKQLVVDGDVYDCIVCLCQVSPRDDHQYMRELPNCDHGIRFHGECIEAWLKDHSTCPICRSHIPRPLSQRLHVYISQHLLQHVISYCNTALDSVANSIGDCRDF